MSLLSRIRSFLQMVFGIGEGRNPSPQTILEMHRENLRRVRAALTNLIFQKKKLADRASSLEAEIGELQQDVRQAAAEDRDDLAIHLMQTLESHEDERKFIKEQLASVIKDIELARGTEKSLTREIVQGERLVETLASRRSALRVRKQVQSELNSIQPVSGLPQLSSTMKDQIHRLEAEMEALNVRRQEWEKDWESMRAQRTKSRYQTMLRDLKHNLRDPRQALASQGAVIVAEPVS